MKIKGSIKLKVLDDPAQHFCVYFDRPGRIEISLVGGLNVIDYVYNKITNDKNQVPIGVYDGTSKFNKSWTR